MLPEGNRTQREDNRVPLLAGVSYLNNQALVQGTFDPATGAQLVYLVNGGSGGGGNVTIVGPLGQTTKSASIPVTIASDQGALAVTDSMIPSLGNTTASGSLPVTLASDNNGPVKIWDGTNTANVVAGDSGFNGIGIAQTDKTLPFTTSISGAQNLLANTDVRGYASIVVIFTAIGSGLAATGQFAPSSGGTYSSAANGIWLNGTSQSSGFSISTVTLNQLPVLGPFFQLAISALTSGTVSGSVILSTKPAPQITAFPAGTYSVNSYSSTGSAVPPNAFYVGGLGTSGNLAAFALTGALNDAAAATNLLAAQGYNYNGSTFDRQRSATAASNTTGTGLLGVGNLGYDGTNYQRAYTNATGGMFSQSAIKNSAVAVSASATVVKNAPGYLSGVLVTSAGTSTAMTFYDNASAASGTIIGIVPATATAGTFWPFNMPALAGITASGSATNPAVTVALS